MSNKDFYDEDEIIDSIVNDTPIRMDQNSKNRQHHSNIQVHTASCGCFNLRKFMINFIIYSVVLMATAGIFPGFYLSDTYAAAYAAFILTLLNTFVKPLIVFFTFPITILTLGLFYLVVNGFILMMTARMMGYRFMISNIFTATFAAIFISILQNVIKKYVLKIDKEQL